MTVPAWLCGNARAEGISFQYLGTLSPGLSGGSALAISTDLSTIVGWSRYGDSDYPYAAMYWTAAGGMQPILPPIPSIGMAEAVSADGQTIVGHSAPTARYTTAWRWTSSGGFQWLYPLGNTLHQSQAMDVSADGSVVVGYHMEGGDWEAFRWTEAHGVESLGSLPGYTPHSATGVSADGSVIVGYGQGATALMSFLWTAEDGLVVLDDAPGFEARAVSDDGKVIVGFGGGTTRRWTAETGLVSLGPGLVHDVSGDGSVVVGSSLAGAWVWDEIHGMRLVSDILTEAGIDITGWLLAGAHGVSYDGTVIVGEGLRADAPAGAWMVTIPEPATVSLLGLGLGAALLRRRRLK
ncbi:MAG: PEP-CTERM sorting domain-containing protein [Planctomycetes bacterium]|nr:PEP-CTERM sorting domain-containing protein [Planctomycetota bacterium]